MEPERIGPVLGQRAMAIFLAEVFASHTREPAVIYGQSVCLMSWHANGMPAATV